MCGETRIFALQLVLQRACPFLLQGSSLPFSHHPLEPLNRSCKIQDVLGKAELSLQQFSLRVDYVRENKLVYSENLNVFTMITPIITYLAFYFFTVVVTLKDFCLKTRSLSSYTYAKCSHPLLSKRDCFLLFLLLPTTLNNIF